MRTLDDQRSERLRVLMSRRRAEDLRTHAIETARKYANLKKSSGLEPELVMADTQAVIEAWLDVQPGLGRPPAA